MIVIMNKIDYIHEVERQLNNNKYYSKLNNNPSQEIKLNIQNCINEISEINSNITSEFDIFPDIIRTSQFYILPKIHKDYNESLPIGYPGRPIVSACNSFTENISKYLDFILQPYMKSLLSYVKDTSDFCVN
jgi:hypothetical protein